MNFFSPDDSAGLPSSNLVFIVTTPGLLKTVFNACYFYLAKQIKNAIYK